MLGSPMFPLISMRASFLMYSIMLEYKLACPLDYMRANEALDKMATKKAKASKMSKIAEAMNKNAKAERLDKGTPLVILDPLTDNAGVVSDSAHVEYVATSPSTEPSRKRPQEVMDPPSEDPLVDPDTKQRMGTQIPSNVLMDQGSNVELHLEGGGGLDS
ncbi:hypothetical protein JCGZ_25155 [Jatropha curcas]|uniref:Uncharacterized protein n=1 Tax=Jatropha curcas TaxID=180498 RepID=A0A067JPZ9_JATCU|nr:hypothetical protein JCGZ_25155 [Jatropha curcas]